MYMLENIVTERKSQSLRNTTTASLIMQTEEIYC
jgi:hypothetical protein